MNSMDVYLFRSINNIGFQLPYLNPLMVFIAEYSVVFLALWMIIDWFFTKEKIRTRIVLVGTILAFGVSEAIAKGLGQFISHTQPFAVLPNVNQLISHEIDNSFPSDHTILFFSICMMLFLGSQSKMRISFLLAAAIVGLSRIWVGVHYPFDVLAGALIGIFVSSILYPFITKSKVFANIVHAYNRFEGRS